MASKTNSTNNNNPYIVHLVLISIQLCFSGYHIVGSVSFKEGADPLVFALYRELIASVLMYLLTIYRTVPVSIHVEDRNRIAYIGFCSFVNVVGTVLALQYISAVQYAMMQPLIPVVATVLSASLGLEIITVVKGVGILCAVGGAVMTEAWSSKSDSDSNDVIIGTLIVCLQVFCMANIIVFQKPILHKYDGALLTFSYYSLGSGFTILLCICWYSRFSVSDLYFDGAMLPWLALAYSTVFATFYAYNAYSWAGSKVSPAITTVYNTLQPIGTTILSYLILGDIITIPQGLGGFLVIIGLIVTVYGRSRELKLGDAKGSDDSLSTESLLRKSSDEEDREFKQSCE